MFATEHACALCIEVVGCIHQARCQYSLKLLKRISFTIYFDYYFFLNSSIGTQV
jgi:hypothetical protein